MMVLRTAAMAWCARPVRLASSPPAGLINGAEEPAQPRGLGVVPAGRPDRADQLPAARPVPAGNRAGQRRGQRGMSFRGQVRGKPGRQSQLRQRRGSTSGTAGTSGITTGSTSGTRTRHITGMAD